MALPSPVAMRRAILVTLIALWELVPMTGWIPSSRLSSVRNGS